MRLIATGLVVCLCAVAFVESVSAEESNWNQFRGAHGDGTTTAKGLPTTFGEGSPEIVWKTPITGRAWSSPIVWGKQIWVTNAPEIQNTTKEKPKLDTPISLSAVCVDLDTGKIDWTYRDRNFPYFSSPAVAADRIVVGCRDKRVHCIQRLTGKPLWTFRARGKVDSSPVVCDGKVIVGSEDGRLYLIGLSDGRQIASYLVGGPLVTTPAVSDGYAIVGSKDGFVYAYRGVKG